MAITIKAQNQSSVEYLAELAQREAEVAAEREGGVGAKQLAGPVTPTILKAAAGEFTPGTVTPARTVRIGWYSKKEAETKKVKHGLGKKPVHVTVIKVSTGTTVSVTSWTAENTEEISIKWAAEPTASEEFEIIVTG